jgi:cation:H+ antiporter
MFLFFTAMFVGFALLVWSADKFVDGASATAKHLGMPTLLIGVIIVGFGTSAPEMVVSATAAWEGNSSLALGNAIGSNIVNIALILGVTAIIAPISVHSKVVKKEIPLLLGIILLSGYFLFDSTLTFMEGIILLIGFFGVIGWSVFSALKDKKDNLAHEIEEELNAHPMSLKMGIMWLVIGLLILIGSSKILVWGAVGIATEFGVSDLIIGLTIIALGTSLPELAASVMAIKKGEDDIAIGNVVGSNMFNILAVIGMILSFKWTQTKGFETPYSKSTYQHLFAFKILKLQLMFLILLSLHHLITYYYFEYFGFRFTNVLISLCFSFILFVFHYNLKKLD